MTDRTPAPPRSTSLRSGSVKVGAGMAFFALSTYVFTALATRTLGPARFSDFSVFWGLVYGIGLGTTLPFEQETSRRVSERWAAGEPIGPVVRTAVAATAVVTVVTVVASLPICLYLADSPGQGLRLWLVTALAFVGLGAAYVSRGGLSGSRHFGSYATQVGVEGVVRVLAAAALAVMALRSPWPWAGVVAAALILAVLLTARPLRDHAAQPSTDPAHAVALRPFLGALSAMVVASAVSQSLVNFGPIVVRLLASSTETHLAGSFLAAALVARAPTFAFAALQAVLMPRLVETIVRRDLTAFRSTLTTVLAATAALGVIAMAVCAVAGPELLRLFSGPQFDLARTDVVLLALSSALFLITLVLQPAALALRQHRRTAVVWVGAGVVFVALCFLPLPAVRAVNLAMVGSIAVAGIGLAGLIRLGLREHT